MSFVQKTSRDCPARQKAPLTSAFSLFGGWLVVLMLSPSLHAAAPVIQFLTPPGMMRGAETDVKATGTFAHWPPKVWIDRVGLEITPGEKSGELKIKSTAESAPGVYWFRLIDQDGASAPQPFVLGIVPDVTEEEPNNFPVEAHAVQHPVSINGRMADRGEVECFSVEAKAGETLVATVAANRTFGSPMDSVLQICDHQGFVLAQNDDARGMDSVVTYEVTKPGTYVIRLLAFREKPATAVSYGHGEDYVYRLTITTAGLLDYALPLAVRRGSSSDALPGGWNLEDKTTPLTAAPRDNDAAFLFRSDLAGWLEVPQVSEQCEMLSLAATDKPPVVTLPIAASGCLAQPGEEHSVLFAAKKGERVHVTVAAHEIGYDLDPMIQFFDAEGKKLSEIDDAGSDQDDIETLLTVPADGEYRLSVSNVHGHGGPRHVYRLQAELGVPDFKASITAGELALDPGKTLQIPIKITRDRGMVSDIVFTAANLPSGVTAEPVTSEGKGATAKAVNLTLTAAENAESGTFEILAKVEGETPLEHTLRFPIKGSVFGMSKVWLHVKPAAGK